MVAYRFEDTEWDRKPKTDPKPDQPLGDLRFRQLFTDREWKRLPLPVRNRFGRRVGIGEALIYRGYVEYNHVNRWGHRLNRLLRLVGAPLPLDTQNTGAAAIVTVTEAPDGSQVWMRQYARQNTKRPFPQVIQSAKHFSGATGIEEHSAYRRSRCDIARFCGRGSHSQTSGNRAFASHIDDRQLRRCLSSLSSRPYRVEPRCNDP